MPPKNALATPNTRKTSKVGRVRRLIKSSAVQLLSKVPAVPMPRKILSPTPNMQKNGKNSRVSRRLRSRLLPKVVSKPPAKAATQKGSKKPAVAFGLRGRSKTSAMLRARIERRVAHVSKKMSKRINNIRGSKRIEKIAIKRLAEAGGRRDVVTREYLAEEGSKRR